MKLTEQLIHRWVDYVRFGNRFEAPQITQRYEEYIGRGYRENTALLGIDPYVAVIDKAFRNLYKPLCPVIWKHYVESGKITEKIPDSGPRTAHYNNLKLAKRCWQEEIDRLETVRTNFPDTAAA